MIRNARTAVKYFVYGLLVGLLFAPKSGQENRKDLIGAVTSSVKDLTN